MRPLSAFCIQSRILEAIRSGAETAREIASVLGDDRLPTRAVSTRCAILFAAGKLRHRAVVVYPGCRPCWCYEVTALGLKDLADRRALAVAS